MKSKRACRVQLNFVCVWRLNINNLFGNVRANIEQQTLSCLCWSYQIELYNYIESIDQNKSNILQVGMTVHKSLGHNTTVSDMVMLQ